jgi:hypothetical protein
MSYSEFKTLNQVKSAFNLTIEENQRLFSDINPIKPSNYLQITLDESIPLASVVNTEKARSELIITPILLEIRRMFPSRIGFFSGSEFNVDPSQGLNGYCDYLLTASREIYEIQSPVVTVVEAKNENINAGLGQCIAEMVAAYRFNQQQESKINLIYGTVTTGNIWKFLKFSQSTAWIDFNDYYIKEIEHILAILAQPFQNIYQTEEKVILISSYRYEDL